MAITGDQLRMARAALKLSIQEVSRRTGIDKSTIVRAEAGGNTYYQTMIKLQALLEAEGVEFIDPVEGQRGAGVALKWGIEPAKRLPGSRTEEGEDGGALQALDHDLADFMSSPVWLKLSEDGRRAISEAAFGE